MNTDFPLWMEIQAEHLRTNYELLKRSAQQDGQAQIMGVVKADAYGHGTECVTLLQQYGMDRFGVASVQEGEILRKEGITGSIYLLGGFIAEEIPGILTYGLIPVLSSPDEFESLAQMANQQQHDLDFHLKIVS
ncbi:MAG: alanine racemase [Candidatus Atribacteria bacterium]|nr:alanine racemase [Candidatus Atribacteria bacterium]